MVAVLRTSPAILSLIALLPGLLGWTQGRKLVRLVQDPLLPERLAAVRRRNGAAFLVALSALVALDPRSVTWTVPLLFLSTLAGGYPSRRKVFEETWSLPRYVSFSVRSYFALFGFWALLAATPSIARACGTADWLMGALLGVALLAWNFWSAEVLRWCLGTRPLGPGPLLDGCTSLAGRCAIRLPRFERIDLRGGVIANALALPSRRTSSVLFTDTLLARLEYDEILAICAHELAHLEHYDGPRLRRLNTTTIALVAAAAGWSSIARLAAIETGWSALPWLALLVTVLAVRARGKQQQETASDLRAVELTSNADAVVRALTKLYAIGRIPRRVEIQRERADTHPSLARRVRDIRKAAGMTEAPSGGETMVGGRGGLPAVTFAAAGIRWTHEAIQHSVEYAALTELRIHAGPRGGRLVLGGPRIPRQHLALDAADVPRVQALLDTVDGRLSEAARAAAVPLPLGRAAAACAIVLVAAAGHVAVAIVALLSVVRPVTALLAGAGVSAVAAAAVALGDGGLDAFGLRAVPALLGGAVFLVLAHSRRHEAPTAGVARLVLLGAMALLALGSIALAGSDGVQLHLAARSSSAAVLLAGLGGAFACSGVRRHRIAAAAVGLLALAAGFARTPLFLDTFGRDPLLLDAPLLRRVPVVTVMLQEFDVPSVISRLQLSPDGTYVAVREEPHSEQTRTVTYHIGRAGVPLAAVRADDAVFIDDRHVLLAIGDPRGTLVREVTLGGTLEAGWEHHVPNLHSGTLAFARALRRWHMVGWSDEGTLVRVEGGLDAVDVLRAEWPDPSSDEGWIDAFAATRETAVVAETRYDAGPLDSLVPMRWRWMLLVARPGNLRTRYAAIDRRGRTELGNSSFGADCRSGLLHDDALVCTVFDGTRTRVVSLEASGRVGALGWFPGHFVADHSAAPGWLTGWTEATPVAIRLGSRDMIALDDRTISRITVAGDYLAALTYDGRSTKVRTYVVQPPGGHAAQARLTRGIGAE